MTSLGSGGSRHLESPVRAPRSTARPTQILRTQSVVPGEFDPGLEPVLRLTVSRLNVIRRRASSRTKRNPKGPSLAKDRRTHPSILGPAMGGALVPRFRLHPDAGASIGLSQTPATDDLRARCLGARGRPRSPDEADTNRLAARTPPSRPELSWIGTPSRAVPRDPIRRKDDRSWLPRDR